MGIRSTFIKNIIQNKMMDIELEIEYPSFIIP